MHANSRLITSRQTGLHPQLRRTVARHADSVFLKPIAPYNLAAFEASMTTWREAGSLPLILDAGCGVGWSSRNLAAQFPGHFVIGVDQSAERLARQVEWRHSVADAQRFLLVRADLVDFWRLMLQAGVQPVRHYVLYPNPWPKIGHLGRRWHGHAVFPTVAALGGRLEVRSNWRIYVEEWAAALGQLIQLSQPEGGAVALEPYLPAPPITPFELKYMTSGHPLWRCKVDIATPACPGPADLAA